MILAIRNLFTKVYTTIDWDKFKIIKKGNRYTVVKNPYLDACSITSGYCGWSNYLTFDNFDDALRCVKTFQRIAIKERANLRKKVKKTNEDEYKKKKIN